MDDMSRLALTVDVEFFDTPFLFRDGRGEPPEKVRRMGMKGMDFLLNLFDEEGCDATFFVLGEIAEQEPEMVRRIRDSGHEIASHGYSKSHPDLRAIDGDRIDEELRSSKQILEEVVGETVEGFRAPAFAMDERVMRVARDVNYRYDSSSVPARRIPGFYGGRDVPLLPTDTREAFDVGGLREYPVSVSPWVRVPVSGAWMRLLGRRYALWSIDRMLRTHGYVNVYVHPWELVETPSYNVIPKRVTWRTGQYTRTTMRTIVEQFGDYAETLQAMGQ